MYDFVLEFLVFGRTGVVGWVPARTGLILWVVQQVFTQVALMFSS